MSKESLECSRCGSDVVGVTMYAKDGKKTVLCPNHFIEATLSKDASQWGVRFRGKCLICGSKTVAANVHDFRLDEKRTFVSYELCGEHLKYLAGLCLIPSEVSAIRGHAGCVTFNIHDDFYDNGGWAIQPRTAEGEKRVDDALHNAIQAESGKTPRKGERKPKLQDILKEMEEELFCLEDHLAADPCCDDDWKSRIERAGDEAVAAALAEEIADLKAKMGNA